MRTWLIAGLTPTALCNYAAGWIPVFLCGPLFHLTETFTYNSVVIKTCTAFYMLWAKNPEKLTIQWSAQTHSVTMQCSAGNPSVLTFTWPNTDPAPLQTCSGPWHGDWSRVGPLLIRLVLACPREDWLDWDLKNLEAVLDNSCSQSWSLDSFAMCQGAVS